MERASDMFAKSCSFEITVACDIALHMTQSGGETFSCITTEIRRSFLSERTREAFRRQATSAGT